MRIGYVNPGYPVKRCILDICPKVSYHRIRSYASALSKINGKVNALSRKQREFLFQAYFGGFGASSVDLLHFFNLVEIPPARKPYVVTFEDKVPRYYVIKGGGLLDIALNSIASRQCRSLLALSDCARRFQERIFIAHGMEEVTSKIQVLHPPQVVLSSKDDLTRKISTPHPLTFIFVGRAFFHKGGGALKVLKQIRKEFPIRLNVVGDIDYHDYLYNPRCDSSEEFDLTSFTSSRFHFLSNEIYLAILICISTIIGVKVPYASACLAGGIQGHVLSLFRGLHGIPFREIFDYL